MRRSTLIAFSALAAACSPSALILEVNLDELELPESGALIAAFLPANPEEAPRVFKHSLPTAPKNLARFEDLQGDATVVVALYEDGLFDLEDGELAALAPARGRFALPEPNRLFARAVTGERVGPWSEQASFPEALRALRFELSACPCLELRARTHMLGPMNAALDPGVLVALSEGRALLSNNQAEFFLLDEEGLAALETAPNLPSQAALRTRDGVVWLFGDDGHTARTSTTGELSFVRGPTHPRRASIRRAVEVEGPSGRFIITYGSGELSAFDGARWVQIHSEPGPAHWQVDLAAVSPTEVWTASGNRSTLSRIHGIEVDFEAGRAQAEVEVLNPSPALGQNWSALAFVPTIGLVVAAEGFGQLFVGGVDGFTPLPITGVDLRTPSNDESAPTRLGTRAYEITPFGRGLFGAGALGATVEYYPRFGFCNFGRYTSDAITHVINLGDDLVLLTDGEVRSAAAVYLENRGRPPTQDRCVAPPP